MAADGVRPRAPRVGVQTLLGDNAVVALGALTAHLRASTGLDVRFSGGDGTRSSDDADVWRHDLVWACGLLTMRTLAAGGTDGEIVAAPRFAGERSAHYRSAIITRPGGGVGTAADVARCRVAINELASWSGCHALLAHLAAAGHAADFAAVVTSGTHRRSAEAVAAGRADAAAIDHTVWDHLTRTVPALTAQLIVLERTSDWPAPPFVLSRALPGAVRERLTAALADVGRGDVAGLDGIEPCTEARYREMLSRAAGQAPAVHAMRARARDPFAR